MHSGPIEFDLRVLLLSVFAIRTVAVTNINSVSMILLNILQMFFLGCYWVLREGQVSSQDLARSCKLFLRS